MGYPTNLKRVMRRLRYSLYAGLAVGGDPEQSIPPPLRGSQRPRRASI